MDEKVRAAVNEIINCYVRGYRKGYGASIDYAVEGLTQEQDDQVERIMRGLEDNFDIGALDQAKLLAIPADCICPCCKNDQRGHQCGCYHIIEVPGGQFCQEHMTMIPTEVQPDGI